VKNERGAQLLFNMNFAANVAAQWLPLAARSERYDCPPHGTKITLETKYLPEWQHMNRGLRDHALNSPGQWMTPWQKLCDVSAALFGCNHISGRSDATEKAAGWVSFERTADQNFV